MYEYDHINPPDCAILGLGFLGRPLAQTLCEHGSRICALKRRLTDDDIGLPFHLDTADLNLPDVFQTAFWQYWADKPVWFCLLPPSSLTHYAGTLRQWLAMAETMNVQHIVFASSTSVYGDKIRICDENTPPDPQTEAAKQILAVENLLLQSRIPHIDILRLGGLYSASRHPLTRLLKKRNIAGGNRPVNVIRRDAAAGALFQTALNPQGRRIRNIVEPDHPTRVQFYIAEAAGLGLPAPDFDTADTSGGKIVNTIFGNIPMPVESQK